MGQVKTEKNFELDDLSKVIHDKMLEEDEKFLEEYYSKVPHMEMTKLKLTCDLALYMVKHD